MTEVIVSSEFEAWSWYRVADSNTLEAVERVVGLLEIMGVGLGHPYSSSIKGFTIALGELRVRAGKSVIRILYVFDPKRQAFLLLGADKRGLGNVWYEDAIPKAEMIYARYIAEEFGGKG